MTRMLEAVSLMAVLLNLVSAVEAQVISTGQTMCWNTSGLVIACAGTGQDGELREGTPRSYTDNGDGTITDHATGLVWEKLVNPGFEDLTDPHDVNNAYSWADAFAVKIAALIGTRVLLNSATGDCQTSMSY